MMLPDLATGAAAPLVLAGPTPAQAYVDRPAGAGSFDNLVLGATESDPESASGQETNHSQQNFPAPPLALVRPYSVVECFQSLVVPGPRIATGPLPETGPLPPAPSDTDAPPEREPIVEASALAALASLMPPPVVKPPRPVPDFPASGAVAEFLIADKPTPAQGLQVDGQQEEMIGAAIAPESPVLGAAAVARPSAPDLPESRGAVATEAWAKVPASAVSTPETPEPASPGTASEDRSGVALAIAKDMDRASVAPMLFSALTPDRGGYTRIDPSDGRSDPNGISGARSAAPVLGLSSAGSKQASKATDRGMLAASASIAVPVRDTGPRPPSSWADVFAPPPVTGKASAPQGTVTMPGLAMPVAVSARFPPGDAVKIGLENARFPVLSQSQTAGSIVMNLPGRAPGRTSPKSQHLGEAVGPASLGTSNHDALLPGADGIPGTTDSGIADAKDQPRAMRQDSPPPVATPGTATTVQPVPVHTGMAPPELGEVVDPATDAGTVRDDARTDAVRPEPGVTVPPAIATQLPGAQAAAAPQSALLAVNQQALDIGRSSATGSSSNHRGDLSAVHSTQNGIALAVHQQLAEAVRANGQKDTIDINLSPEELGKVRLSLHHDPHGLRVEVVAERSETVELIRRHLSDLHRDLRGLGHGSVTFSFGDPPPQSRRDGNSTLPHHAEAALQEAAGSPDLPLPRPRGAGVSGLDIRL